MHGLKRLRHYKRRFNEAMGTYLGPDKDGNDHAADAFGEYALNCALMPAQPLPAADPIKQLLRPRTMADVLADIDTDDE